MNNWLGNLLFFVGGAAIGFGGASMLYNKKINDIVNAEADKLSQYYDEIIAELDEKIEKLEKAGMDISENEDESKKIEEAEKADNKKNTVKKNTKRTAKVNAAVKAAESENEPNYDEIIDNLNYNRYSTKNDGARSKPYRIEQIEYDEVNGYDKKLVSYFPDDEVFMDAESEEVINGANRVFGADNVSALADIGEMLIRNEKLETDYKLFLESGSYSNFLEEKEWDE